MYLSDYRNRVDAAVAHVKMPRKYISRSRGVTLPNGVIETAKDLLDAIERRATTEKTLRRLFDAICCVLEPPSCWKSHCKHYTVYAFCNCSDGRVPGRCKEHRQYVERKKKRAAKATLPEDIKKRKQYGKEIDSLHRKLSKVHKPIWRKITTLQEKIQKLEDKYKHPKAKADN
jgi:hypothetical protein